MMNSYDDIKLGIVKSLNSTILNNAFKKLYENDNEIVPAHDYTPNVWENKWFNDEVIPGYSRGYCVWRNAYTDISSFLSNYGDLVFNYAQENELLQNYLLSSWTSIKSQFESKSATLEIWRRRYYNVISGYSKETSSWYEGTPPEKKTKWEQLLPPLFDYGPYTSPTSSPRVEIYISKKDDNKDLLSSTEAWSSIVLSSWSEYERFVKEEIDAIFEQHMKNYHLDGQLTPSEINNVLLHKSLSNFSYNEVQNTIRVKEHDQFMNTDGFDYVIDYKRYAEDTANDTFGDSNKFWTYKWYRLWSSGLLEHGGVVKCNPAPTSIDANNPANYIIKVDLTWNGQNDIIYNYNETSGNSYGVAYERLYYGNKKGKATYPVFETVDESQIFLNGSHYDVTVTPVVLQNGDIDLDTWKYRNISAIADSGYPTAPTSNKNSSYLVTEVHHLKNSSFCFTRSDTDKLDASKVQYYQYYTVGYRKIIDPDYDFTHAQVLGLKDKYEIDKEPVVPSIVVMNNLSAVLQEGKDYKKTCKDNDQEGLATMQLVGIRPYIGIQDFKFRIVNEK